MGAGNQRMESVPGTANQVIIDAICDQWHRACELIERYRREGNHDLAFFTERHFDGWLDGVALTALVSDMDDVYELAKFSELLWIYRTTIEVTS